MKRRLMLFLNGMNGRFVACFKSRKMFCIIILSLIKKTFKALNVLATRILEPITRLLIKLNDTMILWFGKPLSKKFSSLITCRGKSSFRLKRRNSNFLAISALGLLVSFHTKLIFIQSCMVNKLGYGVQTSSFHANFSLMNKEKTALKNQVEKYFLNKITVNKPF
jgi:hypothetical protein